MTAIVKNKSTSLDLNTGGTQSFKNTVSSNSQHGSEILLIENYCIVFVILAIL